MRLVFTTALSALVLFGITSPANADSWAPRHSCYKPVKPYKFTSKHELESFLSDVDRYKECIERFVRQHREEAQNHLDGVKGAIDEWNNFVRFEMN